VSLVTLEDVTVGYTSAPLLENVDIRVEPGEIVAMLGRNGIGKTSTLNLISGLLRPCSGSVTLLGDDVDYARPHRNALRGLGHVPEGRCLFTKLTVQENLRTGAKRDPSEILDLFPLLTPLMPRQAGLLSGGEQQMLAIARALMGRPKLLLVDEMSMGLAPLMTHAVLGQLRIVADQLQVGVLIVEQFVHMVLGTADRAYVYGAGGVAFAGTAREVRANMDIVSAAYLGEDLSATQSPPLDNTPTWVDDQ